MNFWLVYGVAAYLLIAATMLFLSWPYAETGEVRRWVVIRDALGWPIWALILIVEVTEEARRTWFNRRVE